MKSLLLAVGLLLCAFAAHGQDTISIVCSEDFYQVDAQFSVSVDGVAQPTQTCTTHNTTVYVPGPSQTLPPITGTWGATAAHKIAITYTNATWGGSSATDGNLYIWSVSYDSASLAAPVLTGDAKMTGTVASLFSTPDTVTYTTVPATTTPKTYTLDGGASTFTTTLPYPMLSACSNVRCTSSVSTAGTTPPGTPSLNILVTTVVVTSHTAALSWSASASPQTISYNVYRSTTSGTGYAKIGTAPTTAPLTYVDSTVTAGSTYFYVVTAVGPACPVPPPTTTQVICGESPYSNQSTAVVPTP